VCSGFGCASSGWRYGENRGPGMEAENIVLVWCSGCDRNQKSGTQCDTCKRWFHNSCGNVEGQMADSGNGAVIGVDGSGFVNWR
jgi:hypothetical protein